jgi:hypothetical protein
MGCIEDDFGHGQMGQGKEEEGKKLGALALESPE